MDKGYVFDYGGTIDSGGQHWGMVLWHAYEDCFTGVSEEDFRKAYVYGERTLATYPVITPSHTFRETLSEKIHLQMYYLKEQCGWDVDERQYELFHQRVLDQAYSKAEKSTAEASKVLLTLKEQGCKMVLVSNFYGNINTVLREFGLASFFEQVVESAVVGVRKPNPQIFAIGIERLGIKAADVTVVGDSYEKDIIPAASLGCKTVWIKGEGWTADEPDGEKATRIISSLEEILKG